MRHPGNAPAFPSLLAAEASEASGAGRSCSLGALGTLLCWVPFSKALTLPGPLLRHLQRLSHGIVGIKDKGVGTGSLLWASTRQAASARFLCPSQQPQVPDLKWVLWPHLLCTYCMRGSVRRIFGYYTGYFPGDLASAALYHSGVVTETASRPVLFLVISGCCKVVWGAFCPGLGMSGTLVMHSILPHAPQDTIGHQVPPISEHEGLPSAQTDWGPRPCPIPGLWAASPFLSEGDSLMMLEIGWSALSSLKEESRRCTSCSHKFWCSVMVLLDPLDR